MIHHSTPGLAKLKRTSNSSNGNAILASLLTQTTHRRSTTRRVSLNATAEVKGVLEIAKATWSEGGRVPWARENILLLHYKFSKIQLFWHTGADMSQNIL